MLHLRYVLCTSNLTTILAVGMYQELLYSGSNVYQNVQNEVSENDHIDP